VQNFSSVVFLAAGLFCEQPLNKTETIAIPHNSCPAADVEARAFKVLIKVDLKEMGNFSSLKRGMRVAGFPNVERITYQIGLATFPAGLVEEKQQLGER
jgi:hypothetical protein